MAAPAMKENEELPGTELSATRATREPRSQTRARARRERVRASVGVEGAAASPAAAWRKAQRWAPRVPALSEFLGRGVPCHSTHPALRSLIRGGGEQGSLAEDRVLHQIQ